MAHSERGFLATLEAKLLTSLRKSNKVCDERQERRVELAKGLLAVQMNEDPHEYLIDQFGYRPFRVSDLPNDAVDELKELLGIRAPTDIGARSMVGKWLSAHPELVTVVQHATDNRSGVYQMNQSSG